MWRVNLCTGNAIVIWIGNIAGFLRLHYIRFVLAKHENDPISQLCFSG